MPIDILPQRCRAHFEGLSPLNVAWLRDVLCESMVVNCRAEKVRMAARLSGFVSVPYFNIIQAVAFGNRSPPILGRGSLPNTMAQASGWVDP